MMFGVDQDGDGEVDYHEFIEMMTDKPKPTKK
jgi:Ca2+-binding EF-hand superfamily protein